MIATLSFNPNDDLDIHLSLEENDTIESIDISSLVTLLFLVKDNQKLFTNLITQIRQEFGDDITKEAVAIVTQQVLDKFNNTFIALTEVPLINPVMVLEQ